MLTIKGILFECVKCIACVQYCSMHSGHWIKKSTWNKCLQHMKQEHSNRMFWGGQWHLIRTVRRLFSAIINMKKLISFKVLIYFPSPYIVSTELCFRWLSRFIKSAGRFQWAIAVTFKFVILDSRRLKRRTWYSHFHLHCRFSGNS